MELMNAIEIKSVSKKYRIYHDKSTTLKEHILFFKRTRYEEHQVINGISFNIEKGTTIGLIGQNGSGKSTLLKLLSGIIYPDEGTIETNGRVSSLLELGAGFHPDFSGRENIYNNASIFGLSRNEIDKRYNQIVEFSELQEFIDNPVRTYSSGMYMRLAFAVAINVDADILLIDEILAVGDTNFQKKCMDKIKELKREGKTIVIVTHDTGAVERICDKAAWLSDGHIEMLDKPRNVINSYLVYMGELDEKKLAQDNTNLQEDNKEIPADDRSGTSDDNTDAPKSSPNRWGNRQIEITDVKLLDKDNKEKHLFAHGEQMTIVMTYNIHKHTDNIVFGIGIFTKERVQCYGTNTYIDRFEIGKLNDSGTVEFVIPSLELVGGSYSLDVATHSEEGIPYDYQTDRYFFNVISTEHDCGIYKPKHEWKIK
jgi:ABC-2 type transport system ATP-binding protein